MHLNSNYLYRLDIIRNVLINPGYVFLHVTSKTRCKLSRVSPCDHTIDTWIVIDLVDPEKRFLKQMLIATHHVPVDKGPLYFIRRKKLVDFLEIAMYLVWRNENVITKVRCNQRVSQVWFPTT